MRAHVESRAARCTDEGGDTLVEVLIAVVLMALTVSAVLAALVSSITSSAEHRQLAADDTLARSFADHVKYEIQLQPAPTLGTPPPPYFEDCSPTVAARSASGVLAYYQSNVPGWTSPTGYPNYTVKITGVQFWNASTNAFDDPSTNASTCTSTSPYPYDASGTQMITVRAVAPNGVNQSLSIVVSNPTWQSCYEKPTYSSPSHC